MGNPDHLAKLRQGPVVWNAWREENPGLTPDLSNVVLSAGETLLGPVQGGPFDLRDALLSRANFESAVLAGAILENADLRGANLSRASLVAADLSFANLNGALLNHADFQDAKLTGTIFDAARLELAVNLTQAQIEDAYGDEATALPPPLAVPEAWCRPADLFTYESAEDEPADPYALFGLTRKAKPEEIRAAYLRLAKRYHPDMNPGHLESERQFKRVSEAYRRLIAIEYRRSQRRAETRRSSTPWMTAAGLLLAAIAAPAATVYWFGIPAFLVDPAPVPETVAASDHPSDPQMAAFIELQQVGNRGETAVASTPSPEAGPAPQKINASLPQENLSERIATAGQVIEPAPAAESRAAPPPPAEAAPAEPPVAAEPQPAERVAALQDGSPDNPAADAPWEEEWRLLRKSSELVALESFIARYPLTTVADEARHRFRLLVAAIENQEELKSFIQNPGPDSPEKVFVNRQLAMLVEKETAEADERAWQTTREAGTVAAFRAYLVSHPNGRFVNDAEERMEALETEISGRKKDTSAWATARRAGTREAFQAYIRAFPKGEHAGDAKRRLATLSTRQDSQRREEAAWAKARKENTRKGYFAYLTTYPNGRFASQAQAAVESAGTPTTTGATAPASQSPSLRQSSRGIGPRWPSSDDPFIDGIPGGR